MPPTTPVPVRFQDLRDFTVQVRHARKQYIVGTGLLVSEAGKIVTCRHVVEHAGVVLDAPGPREVCVAFPSARPDEPLLRASVVAHLAPDEDDVVLLQLVDGGASLGPGQRVAKLGRAEPSFWHEDFRCYGFPDLGPVDQLWAKGTFRDSIYVPSKAYRTRPVQLDSNELGPGMSGAGVLDTDPQHKRNVIAGIVFKTNMWIQEMGKNQNVAWAVDPEVLSAPPFDLPLYETVPMSEAPQPKTDIAAAQRAAAAEPGVRLFGAPPPLGNAWAARRDLVDAIGADWGSDERRVVGLVGFGGGGKSSLARRLVDLLLSGRLMPAPQGVFWWSFYDSADLDQFFEELLRFLGGGKLDPRQINSAYMRAQVAGAMLGQQVLFVLDGFEVMQYERTYQYGLVKNMDLLSFLEYMADPTRHQSFCVITSRVPVYQLASYFTYTQYTVGGLDVDAGRHLLRTRGVRGSDDELTRLVQDWEGHPLTLELIADHLARNFAGDVTRAGNIPPPSAQESPYERVQRVLYWYDERLSDAERSFLTCFSAFRVPVRRAAIEYLFRSEAETFTLASSVVALDRKSFNALFERLLDAHIVQRRTELATTTYSSHPLVRDFYARRLQQENHEQVRSLHLMIKEYYVAAGAGASIKQNPSLRDLAPLFEVVHHACQAGAFDEGYRVYREEIERSTRESTGRMLTYKLGAYTQDLDLMREFFADSDFTTEPQVSRAEQKSYVLNEVGLCLMALGRLTEALPLLERSIMVASASNDWEAASKSRQNVAEIYIHLGRLQEANHAAEEAVSWIPDGEFLYRKWRGLSYQAWSAHLRGELSQSENLFRLAFEALNAYEPNTKYLYDLWGVWHAEHLRRTGQPDEALRITEENARVTADDAELVSQCHRVLGDLYADRGDHHRARLNYDEAVRVARNITHEQVLIESLLGRGGWAARRRDVRAAEGDLSEALGRALAGGYRIYEIDIRSSQAWCRLADGDATAAADTARRARTASEDVGYFWGQQDSDAVLAALSG